MVNCLDVNTLNGLRPFPPTFPDRQVKVGNRKQQKEDWDVGRLDFEGQNLSGHIRMEVDKGSGQHHQDNGEKSTCCEAKVSFSRHQIRIKQAENEHRSHGDFSQNPHGIGDGRQSAGRNLNAVPAFERVDKF